MISLQKPSAVQVDAFLSRVRAHGFSYSDVGATLGKIPVGYTIDHNRIVLGRGVAAFRTATAALQRWQMFDLGWVKAFPDSDRIAKGATVAVLISHLGFWSLHAPARRAPAAEAIRARLDVGHEILSSPPGIGGAAC